jgi:hypothetical protein
MHARTKLALAGLTATLLMALAVSSASANRLSISNQQFRWVWSPLTFIGEGGAELTVRCPVTLEGSLHERTIVKTLGALVGYVTRGIAGGTEPPCTGGTVTVQAGTLPWHVTYEGFTGRLPTITRVRLLLRTVAFAATILTVLCLYKENGTAQAAGELNVEAGGNANTLTADHGMRLPRFSGNTLFCPPEVRFEGDAQVTLLGSSTTRIKVTLI